MRWYWPKVTNLKEASAAAYEGAAVCYLVAFLTAIVAGVSAWHGKPVLGLDAWAFFDAALFAVAGWRISRLSRPWAVVGLVMFIVERIYMLGASPVPIQGPGILVALAFTLGLIAAVRGTFAWHALKKKESAAESVGATINS